MGEEIMSFKEMLLYFQYFKKNLKRNAIFILVTTIIIASLFLFLSYYRHEGKYEASSAMIITREDTGLYDVETELKMFSLEQNIIKQYISLAKTNGVSELIIDQLGLDMTNSELQQKIVIEEKDNSGILAFKVLDEDEGRALDIANELAKALKDISMNTNDSINIDVLHSAIITKKPDGFGFLKVSVIGVLAGLILSSILMLVRELTKNSFKSLNDFKNYTNIPVLAVIPKEK